MNSSSFAPRLSLFVILAALSACAAEPTEEETPSLGVETAPIVNGEPEEGWVGVGALTADYIGWGYQGSFCSGSLIASQWVMTAAHCVTSDERAVSPETTLFYVGTNANPAGFGVYPEGRFYRADAFYVHPNYDPPMTVHDIGLVHLSEPVDEDIPAYDINDIDFTEGDFVGRHALYVGFGVTDGVSQTGSGYKRSTTIEIQSFYDSYYSSYSSGTGVCFGDSGGPGLLEIDGEWRIIGVNSTVASTSNDPCDGYSNQTRVDEYADWVRSYVDSTSPDCRHDPSICWCEDACQPSDGSCENDLCRNLSCRGGAECMGRCDPGDQDCYTRCALNSTEEAEVELREFYLCVVLFCRRAEGVARTACIEQNCGSQKTDCYDIPEGDADCQTTFDCAMRCDPRDISCEEACYVAGDDKAREDYEDLMTCGEEACGARWLTDWDSGELYDQEAWNACFYEACGPAVDACRKPVNCDPLEDSCPSGHACLVTGTGATDCFRSAGTGATYGCVPDGELVGCGQGLACVEDELGFLCQQMCRDDEDCPEGVACSTGLFPGDEDMGVCWCRDADRDGSCSSVDCDEADRTTYPGAVERCGDEIDNDCDDEVDEGCEACEDLDEDGYCDDVDCDDDNLAIHPGPTDACGDGIDGNCDGEVDEGCEDQCTDGDGDGFCEEVECDDADEAVNPRALEVCGDDIDNNCDGVVDEGCPSVDDGSCAAGGGAATPWTLLLLLLLGGAFTLLRRRKS